MGLLVFFDVCAGFFCFSSSYETNLRATVKRDGTQAFVIRRISIKLIIISQAGKNMALGIKLSVSVVSSPEQENFEGLTRFASIPGPVLSSHCEKAAIPC